MSESWKGILETIAAFSTPLTAVIAVYYTRSQARTDEIRRKQELFEIRYAFYKRLRNIYLSLAKTSEPVDPTYFFDFAEEASFLFSDDVGKHVAELADHKIPEQVKYGIIDDHFVQPFKKYLRLK